LAKIALEKKREARLKKLDSICAVINKGDWGGAHLVCVLLLDREADDSVKRIPSGNRDLDDALGGGWPRGRVCEIFGPESSGKTTICYHAIAEFQHAFPDEDIGVIDSEHSFDPNYARNGIGVDTDTLLIHQPNSGEQALNVLEQMIDNGVKLAIVDSVAALTPQAELDGEIGDSHVAVQARLMSQALRKLVRKASINDACILFTNQVREKIGVMFGKKTTTPGGRSLKFYASIRAEVIAIGRTKKGEEVIASKVKTVIAKNKTAPPFRIALFDITFGKGIDKTASILDAALASKIINKSGAWFNYGEIRVGQGRPAALEFLNENPEIKDEIEAKIDEIPKEEKEMSKDDKKRLAADTAESEVSPEDDVVVDAEVVEDDKPEKGRRVPTLNTNLLDDVEVESV